MLNPETVLIRRSSGVKPRESLSSMISSNNRGDNPLLFTGGGYTTIELDLVFDVSITGATNVSQDVRDLTKPLWDLTENHQRDDRLYRPALCRFIWGKCWNIPGVISAVAERLESFTPEGIPRRSWLRLRLIRMQEQAHSQLNDNELWSTTRGNTTRGSTSGSQTNNNFVDDINAFDNNIPSSDSQSSFFNTDPEPNEYSKQRIDLTAHKMTGDSSRWREILLRFINN